MVEPKLKEHVPVAEKKPPLLAAGETRVEVLRKDLASGDVARRLGSAYDASVDSVLGALRAEAGRQTKNLGPTDEPKDIEKWKDIVEQKFPTYFTTYTGFKYTVEVGKDEEGKPRFKPQEYNKARREFEKDLRAAITNKDVEAIANVVKNAEVRGVIFKVTLVRTVEVAKTLEPALKRSRDPFVKSAIKMIDTGVTGGNIDKPFPMTFTHEELASLIVTELQKRVGANQPKDIGFVSLEKALADKRIIPTPDHVPLKISLDEEDKKKIVVNWAGWILLRKVAMLVPEKTPTEKMA